MNIQLIRHATHIITFQGKKILLDPMFSEKDTLAPVPNAPNQHLNNPLSELTIEKGKLTQVDAIIVTHTHRDHFDDEAILQLAKNLPLFCQPEDEEYIKDKGFKHVVAIDQEYIWEGIKFIRTPGKHGKGELAEKMGPVSGFILKAEQEPVLYIIGDSVWYSEIEDIFRKYAPQIAVAFAGEARFLVGEPITMGLKDIDSMAASFPETTIIVSHMESWNHCLLTRDEVLAYRKENGYESRILVPENGEILAF